MSPLPRLSSMKSSLPAPRRRASTVASTAAKENSKEASQCRLPLPNRDNVLQGCSKKPLTEMEKPTVGAKDLKSFEKQVPRAPSVLTAKNRRFSTGSFNLNSNQKMDTKFKMAAFPKENPLNATYCLPRSDGKRTGQILLKTKGLDVLVVKRCLPNISVANTITIPEHELTIPEHELTQSVHSPVPLVEPSNLPHLLTRFVAEECFCIAAELSTKSKTCLLRTVDAINPVHATNVSLINDEPIPSDCSQYSFCSDTSPAKSPQFGCTSKLQENSLKGTTCPLIPTKAEIKMEDSSVGAKMNNNYIETGTLPHSPLGDLLQLNETMTLSDPNEHKDGAPKHEAYSRNILSKSPTVSNCKLSRCTVDLIQLDGAIVVSGASNTPSLCTKNDTSHESAMPAKTLSNCKSLLSKSPLSTRDLLLCGGAMLSDNKIVLPKHRDSFGNELHKATVLFDCMPSLFTRDLIQLNETMTERPDATFDISKHESSFGNAIQASTLSNCKLSLSTGDIAQLNGTRALDDHKNATFDTSKHEGSLGNDTSKVTALSNCKLSLSTGDIAQLNGTRALDDHKNATFDTSKHEGSLGNDTSKVTALSNCKLSLSTGDMAQLNGTRALDDHKNATFDTSKHEGSLGNDTSKVIALSNCKLSLSTGDVAQLNRIVIDCKDAIFDASKHEDCLENDLHKTTDLPNCKLSQSSGGSNEVTPLSSKNLKLVRESEGHQGSALDSPPESQRVECHGESSDSQDSNLTLNLVKGDEATCTEKRLSEAKQGSDGDVSCSAELHKGTPDLVKDVHSREPSQNKELNICASADLVHDVLGSEWAPFCMSTPSSVALKPSFLEYLPFDHSFQTSSSTLDDTRVIECPHKRVETKDDSRSSGTDTTETKTCSRKIVNAPRLKERLQPTKVVTGSSLKPIYNLAGARRKNINVTPESEEYKCGAEKNSVPLPARTSRPGSSSVGRGGRPPAQAPNFSKMCLPKPRLVSGRPSSLIGTGQNATNKEHPMCQTGVNTKMPPKAERNQFLTKTITKIPGAEPNLFLTKAITKIPGIKGRSPQVSSQPLAQGTKKAESKQVERFNVGMGGPPSVNKRAHKSLVSASKNIVTGIKRPSSVMEQKRLCPSPKRSKAVGEGTFKFPKKSGTKPPSPLQSKPRVEMKAESLPSEVNLNKTAVEESKSKRDLHVAKLHKMQELAEKMAMLELQNAALRQERENPTPVPEEETNIDAIIRELEEKVAVLELQNAALRQEKENPPTVPE